MLRSLPRNESIPANSDGLLHVGERAALVEQLSYLKKRNAQLMKQQRAVLLAACEAQAAHAQCADFAGELMRSQMESKATEPYEKVVDKLQRLEHENAELLRKTAVLVDYVRATAPMPRSRSGYGGSGAKDDDDDDYSDDDDDDAEDAEDRELPPKGRAFRVSCLPQPTAFDHFASRRLRECKWDSFVSGILSAFGTPNSTIDE